MAWPWSCSHSLGSLWAVVVTSSLRMEHHQSPHSLSVGLSAQSSLVKILGAVNEEIMSMRWYFDQYFQTHWILHHELVCLQMLSIRAQPHGCQDSYSWNLHHKSMAGGDGKWSQCSLMLPLVLSSTNPGALPGIGAALESHAYDALVKHTNIWSFV